MKSFWAYVSNFIRVATVNLALCTMIACVAAAATNTPTIVFADTAPQPGTPPTVSVDPLPTVQINGIVLAQVVVGNTVYATGQFSQARPAGVGPGGVGSVTRTNLIAYDIATGNMDTSFVHSLTGGSAKGRSIAASPDGTRLYVGGSFTTVDGKIRKNFAAFDLTSNRLLDSYSSGFNDTVLAISATDNRVYIGGRFTQSGGQNRQRLAAFEKNGTLSNTWRPSITSTNPDFVVVNALLVMPSQNNLIIGGSFNRINGAQYLSNGAVKLDSGTNVMPWASTRSDFPIRDQVKIGAPTNKGYGTGITSLSTNGSQVFLTSWGFGSSYIDGFFEGRASISPVNGDLLWANDCHGDSSSAFPINGVLYSVGHPHDCRPMGLWGDLNSKLALAETIVPSGGVNVAPVQSRYSSFAGIKHTTQLAWYPHFDSGPGDNQSTWSVTGNSNYVVYGGKFEHVESKPQQGLVRFALSSLAPNKVGPARYNAYSVSATKANLGGSASVNFNTTFDSDNEYLTYRIYRDQSLTPLFTKTIPSRFWNTKPQKFIDSGLTPGSAHKYRLTVSDPFGNLVSTNSQTVVDDTNSSIVYSAGAWISEQAMPASRGAYGNGIHHTKENGATATFTFTGTSISFITEKSTSRGDVEISVDSSTPIKVSAYTNSSTRMPQQNIYTKAGLPYGNHTITVKKVSGMYMVVDSFIIR